MKKITALTLCILFGFGAAAFAKQSKEAMFNKKDLNGDGFITLDEQVAHSTKAMKNQKKPNAAALGAEHAKKVMKNNDKNEDGKITLQEHNY